MLQEDSPKEEEVTKPGKFNYEFSSDQISLSTDMDQDGQKSVEVMLKLTEAMGEAFNRGEALEGVKAARVKFENGKMLIEVDTDRDGENVVVIKIDIGEGISEFRNR